MKAFSLLIFINFLKFGTSIDLEIYLIHDRQHERCCRHLFRSIFAFEWLVVIRIISNSTYTVAMHMSHLIGADRIRWSLFEMQSVADSHINNSFAISTDGNMKHVIVVTFIWCLVLSTSTHTQTYTQYRLPTPRQLITE